MCENNICPIWLLHQLGEFVTTSNKRHFDCQSVKNYSQLLGIVLCRQIPIIDINPERSPPPSHKEMYFLGRRPKLGTPPIHPLYLGRKMSLHWLSMLLCKVLSFFFGNHSIKNGQTWPPPYVFYVSCVSGCSSSNDFKN